MSKFHIEHQKNPCGMTNNRIVEAQSFSEVIQKFHRDLPKGKYVIHRLDPYNIYRTPLESMEYHRV